MAESALEQAVREAASGGSQARRRVYELLAQDSLYVDATKPSGEPGDAVKLSTTTRGGRLEMAVFTSTESALAHNPNEDAYRVHAPSSWIFLEAQRLGCAVVWINSPQCEIQSADFAALAKGLVPGDEPKAAPTPAPPVPPKEAPSAPPKAAPSVPSLPEEGAPVILAPSGRVPGEAQAYLATALGAVPEISAAYFFDLIMPGEARMLCLGLRLNLPSAEWNGFVEAINQLDVIPGFPNGVAVCPMSEGMFASACDVGIKVL